MKNFIIGLKLFIWITVLTGFVYPLSVTGVAFLLEQDKANGSLIFLKNELAGSLLIAQKFVSDKYFWSRPSAVGYNTLPSGGSNLSPTSKKLQKTINDRITIIKKTTRAHKTKIPAELLFASASGLDPHISPETAFFQVDRIVEARNLNTVSGKKAVKNLIHQLTENSRFTFIGPPYVNVLRLNLGLDQIEKKQNSSGK
jgi:potassium-transporting ATPase KdpC subunit